MAENFPKLMENTNLHIQDMAYFLLVADSKMQTKETEEETVKWKVIRTSWFRMLSVYPHYKSWESVLWRKHQGWGSATIC